MAEVVYAVSQADHDPFDLPTPDGIPEDVNISPGIDPSKGAYDYSMIQNYSDLDYRRLDATLGVRVHTSPRASLTGSLTLMNLDDQAAYVYGDLTGTILVYAAGATVKF